MNDDIKQHLISFAKGLGAAIITSIGLSIVQYFGAHIPDVLQFLTVTATSTVAVMKSQ